MDEDVQNTISEVWYTSVKAEQVAEIMTNNPAFARYVRKHDYGMVWYNAHFYAGTLESLLKSFANDNWQEEEQERKVA